MALWLAASLPACRRLSELIDCQPLTIFWDPVQQALFAAHYVVLSLPFLLAGYLVGGHFLRSPLPASLLYFSNMAGSAAGVAAVMLALRALSPAACLDLLGVPVLLAGAWRCRRPAWRRLYALGAGACVALAVAQGGDKLPAMSAYKGLERARLLPDAVIESVSHSPFGFVCVLRSDALRYAPGLALGFTGRVPPQKTIFVDGEGVGTVCDGRDPDALKPFFDALLGALPYAVLRQPDVLVVEGAGGLDVLAAVLAGARHVTALETNPDIVALMEGPLCAYSGALYSRHDVEARLGNPRLLARASAGRYDLVVLPMAGTPFASATGTSAQDAGYLFTVEALADFLLALRPGGALAMTTWISVPPRDELKAFATALAALRRSGAPEPARHLFIARSLRTAVLLVSREPLESARIEAARIFCRDRGFDLIFHPGLEAPEANRFNVIPESPHFRLTAALAGVDADRAVREHLYDLRPATDDRPYFAHFFRWRALPQLLARTGPNAAAQIGWGYMFLLVTIAQALPLGALLVLAPLAVAGRGGVGARPWPWRGRVYGHFAALGLGYMSIEMAAIQQAARLMPHPVFALGLVLMLMLSASALGALAAERRHGGPTHRALFGRLAGLGALCAALWMAALRSGSPVLFGIQLAALAALAFLMGMPFPRTIAALRREAPELVPWAWGMNGLASVLAALLAGLLGLSAGLAAVTLAGALAYAGAAFCLPRELR